MGSELESRVSAEPNGGAGAQTETSVVYLLGSPGVGKRTIGRALARRTGAVLLDNHLINRPVMSVMAWDGASRLPDEIWTYTGRIREAMLEALEQIAPPDASYVFTNSLEDDDRSRALLERIRGLAVARGSVFAPVFLTCEREEQLRRATSVERRQHLKLSGREATEAFLDSAGLLRPDHPNLLELDVTSMTPDDAAKSVVAHVVRLRGAGRVTAGTWRSRSGGPASTQT